MDSFPPITQEMLDALDFRFPERCPDPQWSDREIWMRVGERRVVRFLHHIYQQQNENILGDSYVFSTKDAQD